MMPLIVPKDAAGGRLDRYLHGAFPDLSRTRIQRAIEDGEILLDGARVAAHRFLKGGETVTWVAVRKDEAPPAAVPPVPVVATEKDFLVVLKPAGLAVHPGAGVKPPTLVDAVLATHPEVATVGEDPRPGIVHRLDKDVSGLMIVARTDRGWRHMKEEFRARRVAKTYLALVLGTMPTDAGTIDRPIARSSRRARMAARAPGQEGKDAVTHWKVLERFPKATLLEVRIETGRTHQIRAHLFSVGHPIVGDPLYKVRGLTLRDAPARPFLHAAGLAFMDPDGEKRAYHSDLPKDLQEFLHSLKK